MSHPSVRPSPRQAARGARPAPYLPSPLEAFVRAVEVLTVWQRRVTERRRLAVMPCHLRRDIGIDEATLEAEVRKPFWRG